MKLNPKTIWQVIIFVLSAMVIVQFLYELIIPFSEYEHFISERFDTIVCCFFIADFGWFFAKSGDKKQYFKSNWIDLISSFPFFELFRVLRVVRVVRIFRLLKLIRIFRAMRGMFPFISWFTRNKLREVLFLYILLMIFVLFYCAAGFYVSEKGINEMVTSYFDAVWWAFITVTSVGYGDIYPKTTEGRLIAMFLSLMGIGLFSLITAEISAKFVQYLRTQEKQHNTNS